jgi:hypothetical protein
MEFEEMKKKLLEGRPLSSVPFPPPLPMAQVKPLIIPTEGEMIERLTRIVKGVEENKDRERNAPPPPRQTVDEIIMEKWPGIKAEHLLDKEYKRYVEPFLNSRNTKKPRSYNIWKRIVTARQKALVKFKASGGMITTEQGMNWILLPADPRTGDKNPLAPPLKATWLLHALMKPILENPSKHTFDVVKDGVIQGNILSFKTAGDEIRNRLGVRFSNREQEEAFAWLLEWRIEWIHVWNKPEKGKKGGWEKRVIVGGTHFIADWDVDVKLRPGPVDAEGENINLIFMGHIPVRATEIILNNLKYHRIAQIPQVVYRMSVKAQLLYRQGIPFVQSPEGWVLTYRVACGALGYGQETVMNQPRQIERVLRELEVAVGWKVKERKGRGVGRVWVIKLEKKEKTH